jgi:Zn-dependent peptidase ImmA (M78 family)/transcriptional regulator with XRE-family HTH domain
MPFYPAKLKHIMDRRGLSEAELSKLGGIATSKLAKVLAGELVPSIGQIKKLAENTVVPYYAFFSGSFEISDFPIADFRGTNVSQLKYGVNAKAIYRNIFIRDFFSELFLRMDVDAPQRLVSIEDDENPEQFAQSMRFELGIDSVQENSVSPKDFYKKFRIKIQELGIFVVQDHNVSSEIDGFALFDDKFTSNYIFVNSSIRSPGRMSFTLAHELAHIIGKRSAISNDYEADNDIERYCNKFATNFILPRNKLFEFAEANSLNFQNYEIAYRSCLFIAMHFKASLSASMVRVYELGLCDTNYYFQYSKSFGQADHYDSQKPEGQKGGPKDGPDQGVMATSYLGVRAAALISAALAKGVTTPFEICERIGLSKKRIEGMVALAKREGLVLN